MRDEPPIAAAADAARQAGLAHVASASFLASRVVPAGGYAVALAGGVALARAAQVAGARTGYGASLAAMLQTIAVLGPSRIAVPLTQACPRRCSAGCTGAGRAWPPRSARAP